MSIREKGTSNTPRFGGYESPSADTHAAPLPAVSEKKM